MRLGIGLGDRFAVLCQKMGTAAENNGLRAALEKDYGPLLRRLENAGHISRDMAFEQIEDLNAVPCIYMCATRDEWVLLTRAGCATCRQTAVDR